MVKDIKKMINHPKLKPDTQNKLKKLYLADEEIERMKSRELGQRTYDEIYNSSRGNTATMASAAGTLSGQIPGALAGSEPSIQNGA